MEFFNGLEQRVRRIVPQTPLKLPEGPGRGGKELRRFSGLETDGILDKGHTSPSAPPPVGIKGLTGPGMQNGEGLPLRVAALLRYDPFQVVSNPDDILHELDRAAESGVTDSLQNESDAVALRRLRMYAERVVDMALPKADGPHHRRMEVVRLQYLTKVLLCRLHHTPSSYPFGFMLCHFQEEAHISSIPYSACQPSSARALDGSAQHAAMSPGRRGSST